MIFGISGYMGSGKSSAAKYLCEKYRFTLIDADKTARKLMLENSDLINETGKTFGVVEDGKINFSQLGEIVFENVENLKKLNSITFPYIIEAINSERKNAVCSVLLDAALLPLISPKEICDFAVWIDSGVQTRIKRLQKRTNLSIDVIKNRIEKQMQLMLKPQNDAFWNFVRNNSSIENLFAKTDEICGKF
ncbi:MAG: dephospho-CoA kinase [Chitinispirillales bacterium]|nr:dephospho-CoA kinase [Chitinispirillales bacterium]